MTTTKRPKSTRSRGSRKQRNISLAPENYAFVEEYSQSMRRPFASVIDDLIDGYREAGGPAELLREMREMNSNVKQLLNKISTDNNFNGCRSPESVAKSEASGGDLNHTGL